MIKYLVKSTNEVRLEDMTDVEEFHKHLQNEAEDNGYTLTNFAWSEKTLKAQGEIVGVYYIVKYTFAFNNAKDPETALKDIVYNMYDGEDY